ncbi:protein of unknown function [Magnetospirillum sp. XM-1]|uniref:Pycsar system effector family protein n=1 Tax=Magnetospirillum sp. XM-1 TaxID=1663591 RepID=UPI00073DE975|nr:Pycsar system effector family protein [Magnetospirillum sp. XM-1]CUW40072.1 protein of unknown function [Magnetospirillum sp. XM-1]
MKDDQQEAYEKLLSASLARTVDWLKFAEAKNAALLTFCSAWVLGSIGVLARFKDLPPQLAAALKLDAILFGIAAIIAVLAILPKLKLSDFVGTTAPSGKNLLYFGDVASLDSEVFKERVRKAYMPAADTSTTDAYLDDMAAQVAINSQIATRKFKLFERGAKLTLVGMLVMLWPLSAMVCEWIRSLF